MSDKARLIRFFSFVLVAIIPVSTFFYQELGALPKSANLLITACGISVFILGWYLMRTHVLRLGAARLSIVVLAAGLGIFLCGSQASLFPSADDANFGYPDGSYSYHIKTNRLNIWGRSFSTYFLHPAIGSANIPNSVIGRFLSTPSEVKVWISKPRKALLLPNGSPTSSDGISVEIAAFDSGGQLKYSQKADISQEAFLESRWIEKRIEVPSGIALIKVTISSGPPGSTPDYDSTLVAFEVQNIHAYLMAIGQMFLVGMAFSNIALFMVISCRKFSFFGKSTSALVLLRRGIPFILLLSLVLLIAYWSASRTSFIYFWDYRNYWQKTEVLYELMVSGAWKQAVGIMISSYSSDYSMLPAVMPAILSLFTGYPIRLNYLLSIIVVYTVPAYIMVAYLAKRLLEDGSPPQANDERNAWIFSSLPVLFGFPTFFVTTLYLMPDIGGVILFVAALLYASMITKIVANEPENSESRQILVELVRVSLGFGLLLSLMFLFRRWYIFAAVGIVFSCVILISMELWFKRKYLRTILQRMFVAMLLSAFVALPLLAWVVFDWSHNIGQHDYANLYSSYKHTLNHDLAVTVSYFGLVAPVLSIAFIILLRRLRQDRHLLFILVTSSLFAIFLFLQIQSPGRHHYYLLMPLLGASLAALSIVLFRRYGLGAAIGFSAALLLGNASNTWIDQEQNWISFSFPGYGEWLPKQQPYAKGFIEIAEWLRLPENQKRKFCVVAGSMQINQPIFLQIWQIEPTIDKGAFDKRIVYLGEVDSVNGPPSESIKQCDIALVASPFQTNIEGQQYNLQIIQEDLIKGSGIGAAFGRTPRIFNMDENTKIFAYERTREITNEEYADLVQRFLDFKGRDYVNPRR